MRIQRLCTQPRISARLGFELTKSSGDVTLLISPIAHLKIAFKRFVGCRHHAQAFKTLNPLYKRIPTTLQLVENNPMENRHT